MKRISACAALVFAGLASGTAWAQEPAAPEGYDALWKRGELAGALATLEAEIARYDNTRFPPIKYRLDRASINFDLGRVDEAIAELETVETQRPEADTALQLALYYRYRGRMRDYRESLELSWNRANRQRSRRPESLLAVARVAELIGENPKTILGTVYSGLQEQFPGFVEGFVGAGDLALRKGDAGLAEEYYQKALEKDPESTGALAGLAESFLKSSDPRLGEVMARLGAVNPRHPRLKAIQIEQALDIGDTAAAIKTADEILAVNPHHLNALALKCAGLFLDDAEEELAKTRQAALDFNPVCSEVYRVPGRIASRHYRFEQAADLQARALEIDPEDREARALRAFDLLRLGREDEGKQELEKVFKEDPFNVQVYNMLQLLDSLAHFERIERGPFVLRLPSKESPVLAEDALGLLAEAFAKYQTRYEIELQTPVHVQVFDNHDDFMVRSVGLPGSIGYMGICFGRLVTMDAPSARGKWAMNWRSVLWHEFVHVVTLQKTKNRMPRWLSEGISVYEETERSPAWGQRMSVDYKALIDGEPIPGLSNLEGYFTQAESPTHLMFGYFLAGEFVNFYVEKYGFPALLKSLELIAQERKAVDALREASGASMEDVDAAFGEYLKKRLAAYDNLPPVEKPGPPVVGITDGQTTMTLEVQPWGEKSSPFTEAMEAASKALAAKDDAEAERQLLRAHELFPDYMAADAPLRGLIEVYERAGRVEDLKRTLRREIDWNQTDFPACQKLVALLERGDDWAGAVEAAQWALGIDPYDLAMRQSLLKGLRRLDRREEALLQLRQLAHLDPQHATDYRVQRVETLVDMQDWPRAKQETVALLEKTPYFWRAQELLLQISEKADDPSN